ncbi:hypothetical protein AAVH_14791 [Aphelenchoides avenae]|nr:hypothetical protein AAVH_14791 [Aphelenchus avenae]
MKGFVTILCAVLAMVQLTECAPVADDFADSVAVQYTRFAPDSWIQAYVKIPQADRQCLLGRLVNLLGMIANSQPVNIQQHLAQTQQQCPSGFDKVYPLLNTMLGDLKKLTPLVQQIFVQFFNELAANGMKGFRKASANYQSNWLKAQPIDQQTMASVFPKLKFFFNGPYSIPLTQQALAVAQCDYSKLPALLQTIAGIGQLAAQSNPPPPQAPYAALHQVVKEDISVLSRYAAGLYPALGQLLQSALSPAAIQQLTCRD